MSKTGKRFLTYSIIVLVFGVLAWPKVQPLFSTPAEEESGSSQSDLLKVEAISLNPEMVEERIYSSGNVRANDVVELKSEVSGKVVDILFEEGRSVTEGQLLVKTNDNELQAQKRRSEFQLSLAEQREQRQERLLQRGGISQEDYEATVNEVNVLRSEIDLIEAQIEKTEIRAPFEGMIGLRLISVGSFISPETTIATLNDIDPVKIDFSVPERYASRVQTGDRIKFNVQGNDSTFTGEVYAIEPRIDTETRTLQIRALSDNPERFLIPGAFANIELILEMIEDALMVPSIAIIPELNRQKVFRYSNGRVEEITVDTGMRTDRAVRVINGLAPGDTVLTTGLLQARSGMPVELTNVMNSNEMNL